MSALICFAALTFVFLVLYAMTMVWGPAKVADRLCVTTKGDVYCVVLIAALLSAMVSF